MIEEKEIINGFAGSRSILTGGHDPE